ncbi:MAG TPA: hypothetical protein VHT34_15175, partial [Clostridia bacterium]|nr:hypothetical protein [Clostridia bacterium]
GDTIIGSIGIIGPTRMEYPRVVASLRHMKEMINQEIFKLLGENPDRSG